MKNNAQTTARLAIPIGSFTSQGELIGYEDKENYSIAIFRNMHAGITKIPSDSRNLGRGETWENLGEISRADWEERAEKTKKSMTSFYERFEA